MENIYTNDYIVLSENMYDKAHMYVPAGWRDVLLADYNGKYSFDGSVIRHAGNLVKITDDIADESFCGTNDRNFVIASIIVLVSVSIFQVINGIDVVTAVLASLIVGLLAVINILHSRWELERFRTAMSILDVLVVTYENSISKEIIALQDTNKENTVMYKNRYNDLYSIVQQKSPKLLIEHTGNIILQDETIDLKDILD